MKAVVLKEYLKKVEDLTVSDFSDPKPAPDQYEIKVHACAINFFDLLQIRGKYQYQPPFPFVAGFEFAGVVSSVPKKGSTRFKSGDRVFGAAQGAYATRICALDTELQLIPENWGFEAAAGLYYTGPTSYAALKLRAEVKEGDWVLIHGAAGGIGLSAVQIAKAFGSRVIASTTGTANISACKSFGADHVIDYLTTPEWEKEVSRITGGHGIDVVLDPVGLISQSLKCAAWGARLVVIGFAGGAIEKIAMNRVLLKNFSVMGVHWGAYAVNEPEMIPRVWGELLDLIGKGAYRGTQYRPEEFGQKPFDGLGEIPRALRLLENKKIWGKAVISVTSAGMERL